MTAAWYCTCRPRQEGRLEAERLDSYRRLRREQARLTARDDPRLRAQRSAELRRFYRMIKQQPHH